MLCIRKKSGDGQKVNVLITKKVQQRLLLKLKKYILYLEI